MIAIGYIRTSGKSQVDGDGPERQNIAIMAFCKEHNLELVNCVNEAAVSGTVEAMDRPVFANLVEDIVARQDMDIDADACIVVERLDRLARDLMIQELLLRECRTRGIKVFAVDQGRLDDMADDGGDPTRVLIRQVMGAIAQWEKSQIVKKLGGARARIKAKTGRCEGRKPFGEGKNPEERKMLFRVLELNQQGVKPRFIVNVLVQEGFTNPSTGEAYSRSFINRLIRRHVKGGK